MEKINETEYLHVVWHAQPGQSPLTAEREIALAQSLEKEAAQWGVRVLALGCAADHLHLALLVPAGGFPHRLLAQLKTVSASHMPWQRREGVWRLSRNQLPYAVSYILCQKEHHARGDLWPFWELTRGK